MLVATTLSCHFRGFLLNKCQGGRVSWERRGREVKGRGRREGERREREARTGRGEKGGKGREKRGDKFSVISP